MGMLVVTSLCIGETGYRIVHPDGTVEYTDEPTKGAERIQLPEIPTYPAPSLPSTVSPPSTSQDNGAATATAEQQDGYTLFTISSPQDEETVRFNETGMTVSLQLQPGLAEGHKVEIHLDGELVATGTSASYTLQEVYRGTHTLSAVITNSEGSVIMEAGPVLFFMRQNSVQNPQRRPGS